MSNYVIAGGELCHYGVKGMKWGVRKKHDYVTVYQAQRNATKAAEEARKASIAESRASGPKGIGSFHKANRKALNAKRKAYGESIAKDRAYNKQIKADKKANKQKMNQELRDASFRNTFGANASKSAKRAVGSGVGALGVAAVGSAATLALSKKGKQQAAQQVYNLSRRAFSELKFSAQVNTGFAIVNGMMGGPTAIKDYRETEKKIRSKYK